MNDLLKRFQEPSSYVAIAVAIAVFFPGFESWVGWEYVTELGVAAAAALGFALKERRDA